MAHLNRDWHGADDLLATMRESLDLMPAYRKAILRELDRDTPGTPASLP